MVTCGPLKDPAGKADLSQLPPYVTRDTPNYVEVLRSTLNVGVLTPENGPVQEESFSPVAAALTDSSALQANQGFYRPEAYLLLVFLSDANDGSPTMTPSEFRETLVSLKQSDASKIMAYSANWTPACGAANIDPDKEPPTNFDEFIRSVGGKSFSLCTSDYGDDLAKIGIETAKRISRKVIRLSATPDIYTIEVRYGSQIVKPDHKKGWSYDPVQVAIILSEELDVKPEEGAKISIRFIPVVLANTQTGGTVTNRK
jgi:hypothetical protein